MPTGLMVGLGTNHGGQFPSAGHSGSLLRFAALHGCDEVREPGA